MGLSSSKQKTTSNATTSQTGTTTPQNPEWVTDAISDWVGRIGSMMDADPNAFVAPASPLQQKAWGNTGQLDAWKGQMQSASDLAFRAGNQGANLMGSPSQATAAQRMAATYAAPQLGSAAAYSAVMPSAAQQANTQGYEGQGFHPTQISANTAANAQSATAGRSAESMVAYQNPFQSQVIDTTLADFDQEAGRARAAQAAQAARAGAFGGSRFALREAQTEGELARARASTAANLRAQGFNTAAALGAGDADRFTNTSQFNAGLGTQNSQFNAGQDNNRALAGAQFDQQARQYSADAANAARQFTAGAMNQGAQFNAGETNQFALSNAASMNDAARFGAVARNQFALSQAGLSADAARYGADAGNAAGSENMGAQNQFALTNMAARNDAARFNAGQHDVGAARALQGAGMLGDLANQYGGGVRQDLGLMTQMGDQQRQIEQGYRLAPLAQLEMGGKLLGGTPFGLFSGQQVQTDGTQSGTSVTKSSPSLFDQLLAAGQLGASLFGGGGGKSGAGS